MVKSMEKSSFTISRWLFISAVSASIVYLLYLAKYLDLIIFPAWAYVMVFGFLPPVTGLALITALFKTILAREKPKGFQKYWPFYFFAGLLAVIVVSYGLYIYQKEFRCPRGLSPEGLHYLCGMPRANYDLTITILIFSGIFISCWLAIAIAIKRLENK